MKRRDFLKATGTTVATLCTGYGEAADAKPERPPSVLWLMTDEQRKDSLGCYGAPWAHTPNLDRLAREGVVFTSAYTPSPVCTPARVSLLTGHDCAKTGIWNNIGNHDLNLDFLTYVFRDAGYVSATFGKQHYGGPRKPFDIERQLVTSAAVDPYGYAKQYDEAQYDVVKHPAGWVLGGRYPAPVEETREWQCVQEAEHWLQSIPKQQPFLLRISFSAPHTPVVPPPPFDTLIPEKDIALPSEADPLPPQCPEWIRKLSTWAGSASLNAEQKGKMRRYYYGYCAFVDAQLGRLLDWMQTNGFLDNTIVAFVSDHGTHLCDHGLVQKCSFYEPSVSVPYFFWYPKQVAAGKQLNTPVETTSLLPTLIELAGLRIPERCTGSSLAEAVRKGAEPPARPVLSGITYPIDPKHPDKRFVIVREGDWKLSVCFDDPSLPGELVNLKDDPYEQHNLFGIPEAQKVQDRLSALIKEHLSGTSKPYANVRILEALAKNDAGDVLCPLCKRSKTQYVDGVPDWSEDLTAAYQCGHCGTRFGMKTK